MSGTIAPPWMVNEANSFTGAPTFSGMSSDISINLLAKMRETTLAGIGGRPGPKTKADVGPTGGKGCSLFGSRKVEGRKGSRSP